MTEQQYDRVRERLAQFLRQLRRWEALVAFIAGCAVFTGALLVSGRVIAMLLTALFFIEFIVREDDKKFVQRCAMIGLTVVGAYFAFTLSLQHEADRRESERRDEFLLHLQVAEGSARHLHNKLILVVEVYNHAYDTPPTNELLWSVWKHTVDDLTQVVNAKSSWTLLMNDGLMLRNGTEFLLGLLDDLQDYRLFYGPEPGFFARMNWKNNPAPLSDSDRKLLRETELDLKQYDETLQSAAANLCLFRKEFEQQTPWLYLPVLSPPDSEVLEKNGCAPIPPLPRIGKPDG